MIKLRIQNTSENPVLIKEGDVGEVLQSGEGREFETETTLEISEVKADDAGGVEVHGAPQENSEKAEGDSKEASKAEGENAGGDQAVS